MRWIALVGALFLVGWPLLGVLGPKDRLGWDEYSPTWWQSINTIVLAAVAGMTGYALWFTESWRLSTAWWLILAGLYFVASLGIMVVAFSRDAAFIPAMVAGILGVGLAILGLFHAFDANPYGVTHGTVISQTYVEPDDDEGTGPSWGLLINQCDPQRPCHEGWIYFNQDVFAQYPVGSTYPGR